MDVAGVLTAAWPSSGPRRVDEAAAASSEYSSAVKDPSGFQAVVAACAQWAGQLYLQNHLDRERHSVSTGVVVVEVGYSEPRAPWVRSGAGWNQRIGPLQ